MDLTQSEMSVSHAADAKFGEFDPKGQFGIRDLGLIKATGGALDARIIAANGPCPGKLGLHRHDVEFQMFYVLKGWGKFYFEGTGEVMVTEGGCVNMPAGIVHDLLEHSDDMQIMEIIAPPQPNTEFIKLVE